jgi:autotransporter translocation and assembly factor TamB
MHRSRTHRVARGLVKWVAVAVATVLLLVTAALGAVQTGWAKSYLRGLIVRQANQYLTATLEIGSLQGSLVRGIELADVRLSRDGEPIIAIDRVAVSYSIRELVDRGTTIARIRVERPRVVAARQPDGRWNLAALVRRDAQQEERRGPRRPIHIRSIEVVDGDVTLRDQLNLAFAVAPRRYASLNTSLAFDYEPVEWRLDFDNASWDGGGSDLTMNRLSGVIANGSAGLIFEKLVVETQRSAFTVDGRVMRGQAPTSLDLHVKAERFAFQEWAGQVGGLRNIAVESSFDVQLRGPLSRLATDLTLHSNAGSVVGAFVLDTTVPGSHGTGAVEVGRLDLARWLSRPDRPSDISGRVAFDLDLQLGRRGGFPRGPYTFEGSHAGFMNYRAENVRARGRITEKEALIAEATAVAYGSNVRIDAGAIGISSPYPYRFQGNARQVDLRKLPPAIPVPRVDSLLAFDYDVVGRFSSAYIAGGATFADSQFLGARVLTGAYGSIDTSAAPLHYTGEGPIVGIDLQRFARELDIGWLGDPRYAGTVAGRFYVDGWGGDPATMALSGGGRLSRADLFGGRLTDADVSIEIADGSLTGFYDGALDGVNPAIAFQDDTFSATLKGSGKARVSVPELLVRDVDLSDYSVESTLALEDSTVRGIAFDTLTGSATLANGTLTLTDVVASGDALSGGASGTIAFTGAQPIELSYDLTRADLDHLRSVTGRDASGQVAAKGTASGTADVLQLSGTATVSQFEMSGISALATSGTYEATVPTATPAETMATVTGEATFVEIFEQAIQVTKGSVTYDAGRIQLDVALSRDPSVSGRLAGNLVLDAGARTVGIDALMVTFQNAAWRLAPGASQASIGWDAEAITVTPMTLVDAVSGTQSVAIGGTWRQDGRGTLNVTARRVFLETLAGSSGRPAVYGGRLDLDAQVGGTAARPTVLALVNITEGRIRRLSYERLAGRIDYSDQYLRLDLRLDQAPGIWLTASGIVPLAIVDESRPDGPLDVTLTSSSVGLGIVEALTSTVREVSGILQLNVRAIGTARDPRFTGTVGVKNAAFLVAATGVRYRNGTAAFQLAPDRVTVETLRLEDTRGRALTLAGSLGTSELRVGELAIDARARGFTVLANDFGTIDVDADLRLRGRADSPQVLGTVTVMNGELDVDAILDRTLLRPYATEAATAAATTEVDALAMLNLWDRVGLDFALHVPDTLRMTGDNVQVSPGTPLGLGSFNLRVLGDLYFYKDPAQPLYVNGSFDSVSGSYAFQGRRFDLDPTSSINFRGDVLPEVYVSVSRVISGVEARVTIAGPLSEPELRLASTPPLDSSDILSLIVFNTSTNQLTANQQQELAVRAGTLAAGFLASPLVSALERSLGLEILEIDAGDQAAGGPRVTIGDELAPGLVARFSRQFGRDEYDEATIEYHLSRLLRIRGTFSDAATLSTRSPFRRVERAGIDLLIFFSF